LASKCPKYGFLPKSPRIDFFCFSTRPEKNHTGAVWFFSVREIQFLFVVFVVKGFLKLLREIRFLFV